MSPLIIPAAIGGLLLLFGSGKKASSSSSSATQPGSKKTALDYQTKIADALSRGDADALRAIANDMQKDGLLAEANALRTSATSLQTLGALAGGPSSSSPGLPTVIPSIAIPNPPLTVPAGISLPSVVAPSTLPLPAGVNITPAEQKRLAVAQAMAMNLRNTSRYGEDKTLVSSFQEQEGLKADGLYGPKSALALAQHGVIPPRPRYWTAKTMKADKASYTASMARKATEDPARAADWQAAGRVANDPVK